jgi:hypothetical protein
MNLYNLYLICYQRYLATLYARCTAKQIHIELEKTKGDHVRCEDMDCRIILKWIRKTGTGDVTGLNSLQLRASLATFT